MMISAARLRSGLALLHPGEFALRFDRCPYCGPTAFVRLRREAIGVRCVRCAASAIHLVIGWALRDHVPDLAGCDACELSARGPLADFLRRRAKSAALSEYFADAEPGSYRNGVRCEDVQRLTYADASFDLVTHTEVLEHVPDDARAFAELHRVMRPGATMLFTVPLYGGYPTVERARLRHGAIEHLMEPAYHIDPLRGEGILAFRDYGLDIADRLRAAGFADARVVASQRRIPWLGDFPVILAKKAAEDTA
jgi:SAM-dependent methyltransferase